jgi:hypothetical protein
MYRLYTNIGLFTYVQAVHKHRLFYICTVCTQTWAFLHMYSMYTNIGLFTYVEDVHKHRPFSIWSENMSTFKCISALDNWMCMYVYIYIYIYIYEYFLTKINLCYTICILRGKYQVRQANSIIPRGVGYLMRVLCCLEHVW